MVPQHGSFICYILVEGDLNFDSRVAQSEHILLKNSGNTIIGKTFFFKLHDPRL